MASEKEQYWKIIGDEGMGGISVQIKEDSASRKLGRHLPTGSIVIQKQLKGDRMYYKLHSGDGPDVGWINIKTLDFQSGLAIDIELAETCEPPVNEWSTDHFADPSYTEQLQMNEVEFNGLKCYMTHRPEGAPKAPVAIIMLPGNPSIGGYHCDMALPLAVNKALGNAGFPVIRFDWDGVGRNKGPTKGPVSQYDAVLFPTVHHMYGIAQYLAEKIIAVGWNFSGTMVSTMAIQKWDNLIGLISLSFGYGQLEFVKRYDPQTYEGLKMQFEDHSQVEIPTLYIFGNRDVHTPQKEVERIVKARRDGGDKVKIKPISQENQTNLKGNDFFVMKGKEDEVAYEATSWANDLRAKLLAPMPDSTLHGA